MNSRKVKLVFTANQLIIEGKEKLLPTDFELIKAQDAENFAVTQKNGESETLSVKKIYKDIVDDRFVALFFQSGEKFPYPPKVIGADLQETNNPRAPEQIELDDQLFVLIDTAAGRIYLNNQKKKTELSLWLQQKLKHDITIKAILSEGDFINRLRSISQISFSLVPDLITSVSEDTLTKNLQRDIYGFESEYAKLIFKYRDSGISGNIRKKVLNLLKHKDNYRDITVIGRDDNNLEAIFNTDEVTSRMTVTVSSDINRLPEKATVFKTLIHDVVRLTKK